MSDDLEVVWSGGELLPPRDTRPDPRYETISSFMLDEDEDVIVVPTEKKLITASGRYADIKKICVMCGSYVARCQKVGHIIREAGRCRVVNLRTENYSIYIGRAGKGGEFGNPFAIGKDGDREDVILMFKDYFYRRLLNDLPFREKIHALKGEVLGCFCKPTACHGDVIADYVNALPTTGRTPDKD